MGRRGDHGGGGMSAETELTDRIIALELRLSKLERTVTEGLHADSAGYVHISYRYELNRKDDDDPSSR